MQEDFGRLDSSLSWLLVEETWLEGSFASDVSMMLLDMGVSAKLP